MDHMNDASRRMKHLAELWERGLGTPYPKRGWRLFHFCSSSREVWVFEWDDEPGNSAWCWFVWWLQPENAKA